MVFLFLVVNVLNSAAHTCFDFESKVIKLSLASLVFGYFQWFALFFINQWKSLLTRNFQELPACALGYEDSRYEIVHQKWVFKCALTNKIKLQKHNILVAHVYSVLHQLILIIFLYCYISPFLQNIGVHAVPECIYISLLFMLALATCSFRLRIFSLVSLVMLTKYCSVLPIKETC